MLNLCSLNLEIVCSRISWSPLLDFMLLRRYRTVSMAQNAPDLPQPAEQCTIMGPAASCWAYLACAESAIWMIWSVPNGLSGTPKSIQPVYCKCVTCLFTEPLVMDNCRTMTTSSSWSASCRLCLSICCTVSLTSVMLRSPYWVGELIWEGQ